MRYLSVVQNVRRANGLALALAACGPGLFSAIGGSLLNSYVEANGWVAAYRSQAVFVAIAGFATFLLIPSGTHEPVAGTAPKRSARQDYPEIFREPASWILLGSMYLCNLPMTLIRVQLKMLVLENGITGEGARSCSPR